VCDRGIFSFCFLSSSAFSSSFFENEKKRGETRNAFFFFFHSSSSSKFSHARTTQARRHAGTQARGHDGVDDDHEENVWNRNDGPGVFRRTKRTRHVGEHFVEDENSKSRTVRLWGDLLSNNGRRASKHRSDAQSLFRGEGRTRVRAKL
jgi:hypothetical protein